MWLVHLSTASVFAIERIVLCLIFGPIGLKQSAAAAFIFLPFLLLSTETCVRRTASADGTN
jgi:hypothetical protein